MFYASATDLINLCGNMISLMSFNWLGHRSVVGTSIGEGCRCVWPE